jgi:DNA-directed RNA polymerase beta subunit
LKALLKANLNEESAQRHREDDKIIQIMNKRVDAMERLLESKMPEEVNRLVMLIEKNRLEFLDARDNQEKQLAAMEGKINTKPAQDA